MNIAAMVLLENPYCGELVTPVVPRSIRRAGPYRQRRVKRWRKKHPPYYQATGVLAVSEHHGMVVGHPDDIARLRSEIEQHGGVWKVEVQGA